MSDSGVRGLLLAGGRSRRMGRDKRLLVIDGESMVGRTARALSEAFGPPWVLARDDADAALLSPHLPQAAAFVVDPPGSSGPVPALANALEQLDRPVAFLLAADMPGVDPAFLRRFNRLRLGLSNPPDVLVATSADRMQVMCAFYRPSVAGALRESLRAGRHCLVECLRETPLDVRQLTVEELAGIGGDAPFTNLNTPTDHDRWLARQA